MRHTPDYISNSTPSYYFVLRLPTLPSTLRTDLGLASGAVRFKCTFRLSP
jgi:hypothetical protein